MMYIFVRCNDRGEILHATQVKTVASTELKNKRVEIEDIPSQPSFPCIPDLRGRTNEMARAERSVAWRTAFFDSTLVSFIVQAQNEIVSSVAPGDFLQAIMNLTLAIVMFHASALCPSNFPESDSSKVSSACSFHWGILLSLNCSERLFATSEHRTRLGRKIIETSSSTPISPLSSIFAPGPTFYSWITD